MAKVEIPDYPDNSKSAKSKSEELAVVEPDAKKVIQGGVVRKKKGLGKKFSETFLADDVDSVGRYLVSDVLIPAGKDTLSDFVNKGLDMFLYGDTRASSRRPRTSSKSGRDREYYSYDSISKGRSERRPTISQSDRKSLHFDDIILESRGDAERVLDELLDRIATYEVATVADLYDCVAISHDFTDTKYGWTDLSDAYVKRTRDGYCIILPRAEYLA